ncbi:MAG TPA: M20/M25/M40 family metallo-hydrolase [Thermoanaerobaculia bacterium]|jgi:acetylornithine deacetylase
MFDPLALARRLIDIASPTEQEGEMGAFLHETLTALGYSCRIQEAAAGRFNVFAAAGGRPRVVLNSHLDTVPPWFACSEDEEFLYGRGACDTKGVIAAMIGAGERLRAGGFDDFAFLFVVGEETDSVGAKSANVAFKELGSEYVVVGEPTESTFARASKGALTVFAEFDGKAGHSAYPERGDSAINKMVAAIAEINATSWGEHEILGRGTANAGVVRGGEKANIIAGSAECQWMFRTVGDPEAVLAQVTALVQKHGGRVTLSRGNGPQFMTVPEGMPSTVVAFNTDVPWLTALGKPLLFGPGSIMDAHGPDEKIGKKDLLDAVGTYHDTVRKLCQS